MASTTARIRHSWKSKSITRMVFQLLVEVLNHFFVFNQAWALVAAPHVCLCCAPLQPVRNDASFQTIRLMTSKCLLACTRSAFCCRRFLTLHFAQPLSIALCSILVVSFLGTLPYMGVLVV